jgi:cephalosporin hydroxylase
MNINLHGSAAPDPARGGSNPGVRYTPNDMKRGILLAVIGRPSLAAGASAASWWRSRPRQVIDAYHIWYHRKGEETYNNTQWLGVEVQKSPLDMWMMQEILQPVKPDVLVEAGAYLGGSAYHFASLFELMGHG